MRGMVVRSSFGAVSGGTGFSSAADRSATEIYEAHHYEASSSHITQQQQQQQQQHTSSSWVQRRE